MIEVVYNSVQNSDKSGFVKLPKNIKQIGNPEGNKKVYIEDYAYTYIHENSELFFGILLGEVKKSQNEQYYFVKAAVDVEIEHEQFELGNMSGTIWENIYEKTRKYFNDMEILGWFAKVPEITGKERQFFRKIHMDNFGGNDKLLFVYETLENNEDFMWYENGVLQPAKGFTVYYEKNVQMQEYLISKRNRSDIRNERVEYIEEKKKEGSGISLKHLTNVAMVLMVLFIGINILGSYKKTMSSTEKKTDIAVEIANMDVINQTEVTPVNKVAGNVETTEAFTENAGSIPDASVAVEAAAVTEHISQEETTQETTEETIEASIEAVADKVYNTHTIKKGETLLSIARAYYGDETKVEEIMEINEIENQDKIYEGQIIKLP